MKDKGGLVLIGVILIVIFLYSVRLSLLNRNNYTFEKNSSNNTTKDDIRNRPFPLAGMDTEGEAQELVNREQILETYVLGNNTVTTAQNVAIKIVSSFRRDVIDNGYGYSKYSPSPKSNGEYNDIKIKLENLNKTPVEINIENLKFIDQYEREYTPIKQTKDCGLEETTGTEPENINQLLNPAVPCEVSVLFEVSTSSDNFRLQFQAN